MSYTTMPSLTLPANLDALEQISQYVLTIAAAANLDQRATYKLRLAVDEIATNIVSYGYHSAPGEGDISLAAEMDEHQLTFCLEDTGIPYDPLSQDVPTDLEQNLDQRKIGGLGVYLAIRSVDKFIYERLGDRNRNILIIYRS